MPSTGQVAMPAPASQQASWVERVFAPYDVSGPKIRLGVIWFALAMGCLYLGRFALATLFALVAGVAALQVCREWRRSGWQPSRLVAGVGALCMPVAAALSIGSVGVVIGVMVLGALIAPLFRPRRRRRTPWLGAAGTTIRCGLFPGLCAAMPVLVHRYSWGATLILMLLVSAYEMGDFVNGSEAHGPFSGPMVGMILVGVIAFPIGVVVLFFSIPPFNSATQAWVVGGLVAVLCPLSQMAASLLLPRAGARAPALRRLDSYLLTGPAWLWLLWNFPI